MYESMSCMCVRLERVLRGVAALCIFRVLSVHRWPYRFLLRTCSSRTCTSTYRAYVRTTLHRKLHQVYDIQADKTTMVTREATLCVCHSSVLQLYRLVLEYGVDQQLPHSHCVPYQLCMLHAVRPGTYSRLAGLIGDLVMARHSASYRYRYVRM